MAVPSLTFKQNGFAFNRTLFLSRAPNVFSSRLSLAFDPTPCESSPSLTFHLENLSQTRPPPCHVARAVFLARVCKNILSRYWLFLRVQWLSGVLFYSTGREKPPNFLSDNFTRLVVFRSLALRFVLETFSISLEVQLLAEMLLSGGQSESFCGLLFHVLSSKAENMWC